MKHTMLHMKLNSAVSVFAVAVAFAVFLPPSFTPSALAAQPFLQIPMEQRGLLSIELPSDASAAQLAGVCFLPDCMDEGVVQGDINMNINEDTEFCESKGYTYYASGECPQYYAKVGQCNRDDHYLKCDAKTWCEQNGYNTTSCSIPKYVDQPCPSYGSLYKQCKTDNQRACRDTGYTNSCPSGQKLKKNSGRCSYDSSYGTCCRPSGCPSYTSLTYSSYGTNGTDGCEYTCYYTCNMNCPSGTSTSNPGGCGGSTRNGCGTRTCYYPYEPCCTPSCTNETGCSCGTTTVSDGCGGTCTQCKSCCNSSSSNWCSVHSTCHGDCCKDGTLKSCDTQCGGSGCSSSSSNNSGGDRVDWLWCCDSNCDYSGCMAHVGYDCANNPTYNRCISTGGTPVFEYCVGPSYGNANPEGGYHSHNGSLYDCRY